MGLPENFWLRVPTETSLNPKLPLEALTSDGKFRVSTAEYFSNRSLRYMVELTSTDERESFLGLMTTGRKEEAIAAHFGAIELLELYGLV